MQFLSKLMLKIAFLLSPEYVRKQREYQDPLIRNQLDRLVVLLYTLLNADKTTNKIDFSIENKILEKRLEAEQTNVHAFQQRLLPHLVYGASLTNDGVSWIASIKLSDDTTLVGRGDCPQKAFIDFDEQWLGTK